MILTTIVTLQAANYALNGKWTWQNEEGHEWDIDVTSIIRALPWHNPDDKQRYYANPFKQLKEIIGWIEDPIRTIGAKSSPAVHLIFEQMSGHQIGSGWDMPWDTKELSFYESMPDRILSVMDKFVPFSFSGSNFAFAFPMSKGMMKYKAVKAYEDMIKAQVDPTLYQKIMPHEEYLQLRNKLDKACQLNGVDGASMFDQAMNTVRGEYYSAMWKAIDKKDFKEAEGWARKLLKIGANVEGIDAYTRQRLRVAMIHDHPTQRKGHVMKTKWNNEFFARIGLIPSRWLYYSKQFGYTLEQYIQRMTEKAKIHLGRKIQRAKEKGQEYYTPDLVRKMQYAQRVAQYT